jgi:hypothetical protein
MDIRLPARQTFDQGRVDACLSCAIATALEGRSRAVPPLAPAFHLYFAYGGSPAIGGVTITRAQAAQTRYGISKQELYPYNVGEGTPAQGPDPAALSDGLRRRTLADAGGEWMFRRLPGAHRPGEWQAALRENCPVLIRFWLNSGYWAMKDNVDNPVWSDTSNPGDQSHAAVVLGLESDRKRFVVQDSRGKSFANKGQWFLPESQAVLGPITDAYVLRIPIENLI